MFKVPNGNTSASSVTMDLEAASRYLLLKKFTSVYLAHSHFLSSLSYSFQFGKDRSLFPPPLPTPAYGGGERKKETKKQVWFCML